MTHFFFTVIQEGGVGLGHIGDFYKMYCKEPRRAFSDLPVRSGHYQLQRSYLKYFCISQCCVPFFSIAWKDALI